MTKFEDRLLDDLMREYRPTLQQMQLPARARQERRSAAVQRLEQQVLQPLSPAPPQRRWHGWAAPVAAATGVVVAVGLAVAVSGTVGHGTHSSSAAAAAAGTPRYYLQANLCCGRPVVRSTTTGKVTATVPVPTARSVSGYGIDTVASARNGTFFVAALVPGGDARIYRFRLTGSGGIEGFAPVPGGTVGSRDWEADAMAASPDGSHVAIAFNDGGSSRVSQPDYITVVDTATGAKSVWRGGTAKLGHTFSVASLSWTGDGRELVYLGQWCQEQSGPADSDACGAGVRRLAQVRELDGTGRGGSLTSGRVLLGQSARIPYIAQALISPDGSTVTAVVLTGEVRGGHGVGGIFPERLAVTRISVATGRPLAVLYRHDLGRIIEFVGAPNALTLAQDVPGRHWLLDAGVDDGTRRGNGLDGWIYNGRLVPVAPKDGAIATEAW